MGFKLQFLSYLCLIFTIIFTSHIRSEEQPKTEDKCAKDGFENCLGGVEWGGSVDPTCGQFQGLKEYGNIMYNADIISTCDPVVSGLLTKLIKTERYDHNIPGNGNQFGFKTDGVCKGAINFTGILFGRFKEWKELNEDQQYLLISEFKKKYGKNVKPRRCKALAGYDFIHDMYNWKIKDGFDVLLIFATIPGDKKNTSRAFARYFPTVLPEVLHEEFDKELKNVKNKKLKDEDNKNKSLGDGI